MKFIDRFLVIATTIWAIVFFLVPDNISGVIALGLFFAVGLFSVLYPEGMIGWAKTVHSDLDPLDHSLWWVPRFIGCDGCRAVV
jgi:hypothetical protein